MKSNSKLIKCKRFENIELGFKKRKSIGFICLNSNLNVCNYCSILTDCLIFIVLKIVFGYSTNSFQNLKSALSALGARISDTILTGEGPATEKIAAETTHEIHPINQQTSN